jgi:hypothetical protein
MALSQQECRLCAFLSLDAARFRMSQKSCGRAASAATSRSIDADSIRAGAYHHITGSAEHDRPWRRNDVGVGSTERGDGYDCAGTRQRSADRKPVSYSGVLRDLYRERDRSRRNGNGYRASDRQCPRRPGARHDCLTAHSGPHERTTVYTECAGCLL